MSDIHHPEPLKLRDSESLRLGYVADLYELLRAIDETMPKDAMLYVEGTSLSPEIRQFLLSRQQESTISPPIAAQTLYPEPETFHLPLAGTNLAELRRLAEHHAEPEVCDHLVVYRDDSVLLSAHDAGFGYLEVAKSLPDETMRRLEASLGDVLQDGP